MIYRSILVSLLAIGAGYVLLTSQIALDPWSEMDAINSRTLPYLYGTGLMLCAFMLTWQQPNKVEVSPRLLPLAAVCLVIITFIILLPYTGLWWALGALLLLNMLIMGERRLPILLGMSISVPLVGWALVEQVLEMVIPL
ncbi:tripartite tricarboxylate transporter TctB family protein [Pseudomonadales bacterium]|nr:tripartite tricarboxylate transporter TctB family protein [Pseudomonadales bacterium]MDB9756062.1 tripartite tricarboxylate transporter TctB family protein [Pseudomonadales bacterium]